MDHFRQARSVCSASGARRFKARMARALAGNSPLLDESAGIGVARSKTYAEDSATPPASGGKRASLRLGCDLPERHPLGADGRTGARVDHTRECDDTDHRAIASGGHPETHHEKGQRLWIVKVLLELPPRLSQRYCRAGRVRQKFVRTSARNRGPLRTVSESRVVRHKYIDSPQSVSATPPLRHFYQLYPGRT